MAQVDLMARFLRTGAFEVLVTHNRFTLVDRSADPLITEAFSAGVGVVNGAVFGGGFLAKGPSRIDRYAYEGDEFRCFTRVRAMEQACRTFGLPLKAAALHLSMRDPGSVRPSSAPRRRVMSTNWSSLQPLKCQTSCGKSLTDCCHRNATGSTKGHI